LLTQDGIKTWSICFRFRYHTVEELSASAGHHFQTMYIQANFSVPT